AGGLQFSKDTVYLDTVFSNISSSTYTLKVYNRSNKNIAIPNIRLNKGQNSKFRLMVDGMPGKEFSNVEMLAKDSMFIFIEVTSDAASANASDFLYTDFIEFGSATNFQKVELVTLVQDAYFLYPQKFSDGTTETLPIDNQQIFGFLLDENDAINGNELVWEATKPYVIYGYAAVPNGKTLTVKAGARIHFHAESGLIVSNDASLDVEGELSNTEALEKEVIFQGDRLEPLYEDVPGQWGTIWFTQGSTNNSINHLTLKNATVGFLVSGNDGNLSNPLKIENTQIYNCTNVGILARTGNIEGKNIVINNCGETAFAGTLGGSYDFTHCTFANYWFSPNQSCVVLNNFTQAPQGIISEPLTKANFNNCIIYGSNNLAILHSNTNDTFEFKYSHCLIKFIDSRNQFASNELYDFNDSSRFLNCIIATNTNQNKPDFKNTNKNQLIIGSNSIAKGTANPSFSGFNDILGKSRTGATDMGAYNFIVFE
ncbi:MAG TPA: hypothetical protein DDZ41_06285, partial [Flavobacterium sp.]|nr:hypothetical protein [Flavobacterium sp.]